MDMSDELYAKSPICGSMEGQQRLNRGAFHFSIFTGFSVYKGGRM
jgi:hypothetical protein